MACAGLLLVRQLTWEVDKLSGTTLEGLEPLCSQGLNRMEGSHHTLQGVVEGVGFREDDDAGEDDDGEMYPHGGYGAGGYFGAWRAITINPV